MSTPRRGPQRLVTVLVLFSGLLVGFMMLRVFSDMQQPEDDRAAATTQAPVTKELPKRTRTGPPPTTPAAESPDTGSPVAARATGAVRCAVDLPDTPAIFLTQLQVQPPGAGGEGAGAIRGGRVILQVPTGNGSGVFSAHDTQVRVTWRDVPEDGEGACTAEVLKSYTAIFGTVQGWEPGSRGYATGCSGHGPIEDDGTFFATIVAEPCSMYVVMQHRGRVAHGPEQPVDASANADSDITLRAPHLEDLRPLNEDELQMRHLVLELAEQLVINAGDPDADAAFLDQQRRDLDDALEALGEEDEAEADDEER